MERQFKVSRVRATLRRLGDVIPLPVSVRPDPAANFHVSPTVSVSADPAAADLAEQLAALLRQATGHPVPVTGAGGSIQILLGGYDKKEAYRIDIAADGVTVRAGSNEGLFAALQTLRQLLPAEEGAADVLLPG